MNETLQVLMNRGSVRNFTDETIPEKTIQTILQAGMHAASGGNLQPISIIRIEAEENRRWFVEQNLQPFIGTAPLNLLFCIDYHRLKQWSKAHKAPFVMDKSFRHFWISFQDVIICAQTIETAANALGIGSVYIGTTVDIIPKLQKKFALPKGVVPVVLLTMGYPTKPPKIAPKLSVDAVVHREQYQRCSDDEVNAWYDEKYANRTIPLSDKHREQILSVVRETEGEEAVADVEQYLQSISEVSMPMRYFGLHYVANWMARDNTDIMDILYDNGLIWAHRENHPAD